jgi:N-acetylglucosamine kinase-like BadF-type ATPase
MPVDYVLGIDQGGTHTRAAVCTLEGEIMAACTGEGACHAYVGMDIAMSAIRETAQAALARAGIQPEQVRCLFAGLTGADWPDEYPLLQDNLLRLGLGQPVYVTNDSLIALRGGTDQPYGAVLIAGSGGNCAIRSPDGQEFIYAYYHDADLQGGHALGRRVLNALYQAETGREAQTRLKARVLGFYGLADMDGLLRADVEGRLSPDIKELAPLLFEEAFHGDPVAAQIVRAFAEGCAGLVAAGLRRFDMTGLELDVVLSGSVFKAQGPLLVETMAACLHQVAPRARLVNARYEPVVGAVLLGLERLGISVDERIQKNISKSARAHRLLRSSRRKTQVSQLTIHHS